MSLRDVLKERIISIKECVDRAHILDDKEVISLTFEVMLLDEISFLYGLIEDVDEERINRRL